MKKLLVFLTFIFCVGFVSAQSAQQLLNQIGRAPVKTVKPKGEMRIFVKEGEEVITNFPSENLTAAPKIHIVLPKLDGQNRYPSIYIISPEELDKEKIEKMYPAFYGKYYFVTVRLEEGEKKFAQFLTSELLPYMEVNYPVSSTPQDRTFVAKNSFAIAYLADLKNISAYLKNAALGFDYSSPLPEINVTKNINLWAEGPVDNIAALHAALAKQNLVYLEDFAYDIVAGGTKHFDNLEFLFNKKGRKIVKTTPYQQFDTLDLDKDFTSLFWINLKSKSGYNLAYVPQDLRIAPPFLNWNKEQAAFNIISGATVGKIKVSGKTEFGKKFKAKFNLINSASIVQKPAPKTVQKTEKVAGKQVKNTKK